MSATGLDRSETSTAPLLASEAPCRRAVVVANPIAGRGAGGKVAVELADALESLGARAEVHLTSGPGDGWRWLRSREEPADLVVAIGGDGTVREVVAGLTDPEVPVAILPFGTANALAQELGLPRDVHRALEVIRGGRTQSLDVATVNGTLSLLVTGIGFDARVVDAVARRRRGPITKLDYLPAALGALRGYVPPRLEVELDGERLDGTFELVLASNVARYGGFLRLDPGSRLDDGLFDVHLFPRASTAALVGHALRGLIGKPLADSVTVRRARRLRVTSEERVPFQIDGDYGGETPVELVVSETRYRLLRP